MLVVYSIAHILFLSSKIYNFFRKLKKTTKIVYPVKIVLPPATTNLTNYRWLKCSKIISEGIISFVETSYSDGAIDKIQSGKIINLNQKTKESIEEREGKRYFRQYYDYLSYTEVFIGNVEKETEENTDIEEFIEDGWYLDVNQISNLYQVYANLETAKSQLASEAAFHGFNIDSVITDLTESIDIIIDMFAQEENIKEK